MFCFRKVIGLSCLSLFFLLFFSGSSLFAKLWYVYSDISSEYNDNIYWNKEDEEEDLINRVILGGGLKLLEEHRGLNLDYSAGFEFFAKNSEENTLTHNLNLTGFLEPVQNLTLMLKNSFVHSKEMSEIDEYGVKRKRQNFWKNELSPSVEFEFGDNRIIKAAYFFTKTRFSQDSSQNSTQHKLSTGLDYQLNIKHTVKLGYDFVYGELSSGWGYLHGHTVSLSYYYSIAQHTSAYFSNSNTFSQYTKAKDNKTYTFVTGIKHAFSKRLLCDLNGGVYFYKLEDRRTIKSFSGLFSLSYLYESSRLSLKVQRGVREVLFTTTNLGLNTYWGVTGTFEHQWTQRLDSSLSVSYSRSRFSYSGRRDRFWSGSLGLNYTVRKWCKAYLLYRYNSLDSNLSSEGYDVNRIMVGFRFTY